MNRDWYVEAAKLLASVCRFHGGWHGIPRALCPFCLAEALWMAYELGRQDETETPSRS